MTHADEAQTLKLSFKKFDADNGAPSYADFPRHDSAFPALLIKLTHPCYVQSHMLAAQSRRRMPSS